MTKYFFLFLLISLTACNKSKDNNNFKDQEIMETTTKLDTAIFGSGCFWCSEAIFERVKGVHKVVSGYAGGVAKNPSYEQVCTGKTGHAEVCQIIFDSSIVSFADLLKIFWKTHDPTTLNRQGADEGTQYRSVIFYHSDEQKKIAEHYKVELDNSGAWGDPIVTEISPFTKFYSAEAYHQNYFANNPTQGYCSFVIAPKVEKFEKVFKEKLK